VTKSISMIVAGEIGATQTRLALCGLDMGRPVVVVDELYDNGAFVRLAPMIQRLLAKHRPPQIRSAAFVVTGPVEEGVSLSASLPWPVEGPAIASEFGIDKVAILNDVAAVAHAIPMLGPDDTMTVARGEPLDAGNQAVISAGLCPGMAGLFWNGTEHDSFVSEGSHADFAPSSEEELRLALHLSTHVPRVTPELLLSRSGVELIYRYLRGSGAPEPDTLAESMRSDGTVPAILKEGVNGKDSVCRKAVETFVRIFGSTAGNLALTLRATGGVYLAGDLVPPLRELLKSEAFLEAFVRKAPLSERLGKISVIAVTNERAALLGAATVAARDLRARRGSGWAS
jgi:glucokinase